MTTEPNDLLPDPSPLPESLEHLPEDTAPPEIFRGEDKLLGWMATAFPPPQPLPNEGEPLPDDFDPEDVLRMAAANTEPFSQSNLPRLNQRVMLAEPKEAQLPFIQPLSNQVGIVVEVDPPNNIVHGKLLKNSHRGIMVRFPDADNRMLATPPEAFKPIE